MFATDLHLFEIVRGQIDLTPFYQALPYSDTEKLLYKIIVTQNANTSAPCSDKEFYKKAQLCVQRSLASAAVKKFIKDMRVFDVGGRRYVAVVDDSFVKPKEEAQDNTSTDAISVIREVVDTEKDGSLFRSLKDYIKLLQSVNIKIDVVKLRHEILRNLRNIGKAGLTDLVTDALLANNYELFPSAIIVTDETTGEESLYAKIARERDEANTKSAELSARLQNITDNAMLASQAFAATDKERTALISQLTGQVNSLRAMNDKVTAELHSMNANLRAEQEKYSVLNGRYKKAVDEYKKLKEAFEAKVKAFNEQTDELEGLTAEKDRFSAQVSAYRSFIKSVNMPDDPLVLSESEDQN